MSGHTPGPWSFGKVGKHTQRIDGGSGAARWWGLCKVFVRVEDEPDATGEANARLIAAAPDLLDAVVRLADDLEDGHWSSTKADLRRLIAKATGSAA